MPPHFFGDFIRVMAANRKLGCLSIFLFVALCASILVNFALAATAFRKIRGVARDEWNPGHVFAR